MPDENDNQNSPPPPSPQLQGGSTGGQDWQQSLSNLIQRQGGEGAAATLLFQENREHRQRIRELEQRVPGEGAVVLTGDQAQAWQAYQGLGAPTDLQQQLEQAQQASTELATLKRAEQMRAVADAVGYKPGVLHKLADGLTLEMREEQVEGQAARVPYVVTGENQAQPLTDYAQQHWADFLPALQAQPAGQPAQASQGGVQYPRQQGGGQQATSNYVGSYFERVYGKKKE
jgi:hypothetical protein